MGGIVYRLKFLTTVQASAEDLWDHFARRELVATAGAADRAEPPHSRIARLRKSVKLLLGAMPASHDPQSIVRLEPGRRFVQRTRLTAQRSWSHECWIMPGEGRCIVADEVCFEPRYPLAGALAYGMCHIAFWNRQRHLRRQFAKAA